MPLTLSCFMFSNLYHFFFNGGKHLSYNEIHSFPRFFKGISKGKRQQGVSTDNRSWDKGAVAMSRERFWDHARTHSCVDSGYEGESLWCSLLRSTEKMWDCCPITLRNGRNLAVVWANSWGPGDSGCTAGSRGNETVLYEHRGLDGSFPSQPVTSVDSRRH